MATKRELDAFLEGAQKRAFRMALFAIRNEQAALDVIQEAMIKLCSKYSAKPVGELPALFGRIVQNCINDHFRKDKSRSKIDVSYDAMASDDSAGADVADALAHEADASGGAPSPEELLSRAEVLGSIEEALQSLPERQRQAFLLRHWEGLDTQEAAKAMGVTQGSVKTHLSRATAALASFLNSRGIRL